MMPGDIFEQEMMRLGMAYGSVSSAMHHVGDFFAYVVPAPANIRGTYIVSRQTNTITRRLHPEVLLMVALVRLGLDDTRKNSISIQLYNTTQGVYTYRVISPDQSLIAVVGTYAVNIFSQRVRKTA